MSGTPLTPAKSHKQRPEGRPSIDGPAPQRLVVRQCLSRSPCSAQAPEPPQGGCLPAVPRREDQRLRFHQLPPVSRAAPPTFPAARVHEAGHRDVATRDAAGIVARQGDIDPVVDIEPLGVVIDDIGVDGDATHEAERRHEITEAVGPFQSIPAVGHGPVRQGGERFAERCLRKRVGH